MDSSHQLTISRGWQDETGYIACTLIKQEFKIIFKVIMLTAFFSYQILDVIIHETFLDSPVYLPLWTRESYVQYIFLPCS